jgi:hypothetical protein
MFLSVQISTFDVPNVATCSVCSTHWRTYILWQLPTEIPTSDAVWSIDILLSLLKISHTCSTFALFVDDGRLVHRSSLTLMSIMEAFMPVIHLSFFHCWHHALAATWLMSPWSYLQQYREYLWVCMALRIKQCYFPKQHYSVYLYFTVFSVKNRIFVLVIRWSLGFKWIGIAQSV